MLKRITAGFLVLAAAGSMFYLNMPAPMIGDAGQSKQGRIPTPGQHRKSDHPPMEIIGSEIREFTSEQLAEQRGRAHVGRRPVPEVLQPPILQIPGVMAGIDADEVGLTDEDLALLLELRADFTSKLQSSGERDLSIDSRGWQEAQRESDARLRLLLGSQRADRLEMAASAQQVESSTQ